VAGGRKKIKNKEAKCKIVESAVSGWIYIFIRLDKVFRRGVKPGVNRKKSEQDWDVQYFVDIGL